VNVLPNAGLRALRDDAIKCLPGSFEHSPNPLVVVDVDWLEARGRLCRGRVCSRAIRVEGHLKTRLLSNDGRCETDGAGPNDTCRNFPELMSEVVEKASAEKGGGVSFQR
jgi:hypothetical protein